MLFRSLDSKGPLTSIIIGFFFVESSETASCNSCFTSSKFVLTETAKHLFPVVNLDVGVPHGSDPVCVVGRWYIMTDHGVHNNQHADDIANHLLS